MISMGGTQHQQAVAGVCWLAELSFVAGTVYFTTAPQTLTVDGHDWLGLGALASVGNVSESEEVLSDAVILSLSIVDQALIATALGSAEGYRGKSARLYLQLLSPEFVPVGPKVQRWAGLMDRIEIKRSEGTGSIELRCSRSGIARMRHAKGLRMTNEQQQGRHPGDTGLRYVRTLIEKPSLWLSKRFQQA